MLEGEGVFLADGEEHAAPAGTWARFDPEVKRNILNRSDAPAHRAPHRLPGDTGYEPMEWA